MREPEINPVILFTTERWAWEGKPLTAVGPNIVMTKLAEVASKAADPARADVGDSIDRGLIVLRLLKEAGFELRIAANPPQEERSDPLDLAAADDNRKGLVEEIADKWLAEAADNTRFADQGAKNEAWTRELRDRAITLKDCARQLRAAFQSRQEESR